MKKKLLFFLIILLIIVTGCSRFKTCQENCISSNYKTGSCDWSGSALPIKETCEGGTYLGNKVSDCKNQGGIGSWEVCCCYN